MAILIASISCGVVSAQSASDWSGPQGLGEAKIDISAARPVGRRVVAPTSEPQLDFDVFSEGPVTPVSQREAYQPAPVSTYEQAPILIHRSAGYSSAPIQLARSTELSCGCETVCDCPEAVCGFEAGCGFETWQEPGCGCEGVGCDECCDGSNPACGCSSCSTGIDGFLNGCFPRMRINPNRWELFAGFNGHTGPMNYANISSTGTERRGNGSFGFYQGFNKGTPISFFENALGWQTGVRFTQNNLSGTDFTTEIRDQIFVTSGLFRKVDYGFQFGVVLDYLYEDWYYRGNVLQIRGETAWVGRNQNTFGFKFATGLRNETALTSVLDDQQNVIRNNIAFESVTQYRFFYRKPLPRCGSLEGFGGWTDRGDGLLGADIDIPIYKCFLWNTSATYLVPEQGTGAGGNEEEGWNISMGFTFRPGGVTSGSRFNRPLLKVADNGSLMVDRR